MKTLIHVLILASVAFSLPTFANKIIITGEPVLLEPRGNTYVLPKKYISTESYNYVTVDGTKRVCYLEKQPSLPTLNLLLINVSVNGQDVVWNCYSFDETYFELTP